MLQCRVRSYKPCCMNLVAFITQLICRSTVPDDGSLGPTIGRQALIHCSRVSRKGNLPGFPCQFLFIPLTYTGLLATSAVPLGILKVGSPMQQPNWVEWISLWISCNTPTSCRHACFAQLWRRGKSNACWSANGGSPQSPPQIPCQPRISNWLSGRQSLLLLARNTALFITFLLFSCRAGVGEINYVGKRTF